MMQQKQYAYKWMASKTQAPPAVGGHEMEQSILPFHAKQNGPATNDAVTCQGRPINCNETI